jgi:hypothetical protein
MADNDDLATAEKYFREYGNRGIIGVKEIC